MSKRRTFIVTITDVVDWRITIEAASEAEAYEQAWQRFELSERDLHFRDYPETSTNIEEVPS